MKPLPKALLFVALCGFISSCATVDSSIRPVSALLPRPGAKVILGSISNVSKQTFDVDVEAMLRDAIALSLQKQTLLSATGGRPRDFVLSLQITDYRPGNAFKRWLIPGYGSTILSVQGQLRDGQDNSLVASIDHQRSVFAGGVFSIGAWERIFTLVADDIAHDLSVRIEQEGEFVIDLPPRSDQAVGAGPAGRPIAIKLGAMNDKRSEPGLIGERYAAFGVSMGYVYFSRNVGQFLRESLADELLIMGHRIVDSGEAVRVMGELRKFWVTTKTTPLYWDIIGEVELDLTIERAQISGRGPGGRSYSCKATDRTFVWPTSSLMGKVMGRCLEELWEKIRLDSIWAVGMPGAPGTQ